MSASDPLPDSAGTFRKPVGLGTRLSGCEGACHRSGESLFLRIEESKTMTPNAEVKRAP